MTDLDTRTARRRKIIGAGLVAVLAVVLIAIVVVRSTGEKVLNENGETLVLVGKGSGTEPTSQIAGELTDVGGCLGIMVEDTATLVVWPHGTTIKTPDPLRVTVDGSIYELGDTIELDGAGTDSLDRSSFFHDKVPDGCRSADLFDAS
ncbi:MAG: hypothetical protein ABWX74_16535 [Aeromicrobium sp.]